MNQRFIITIEIVTDCEETVDDTQVEAWMAEKLDGCDMADVLDITASEVEQI